jgi:hypothetical protein
MKRMQLVLLAAAGSLCLASTAAAQGGMNFFKKPNIADIFRPVVGSGALYEEQRTDQQNAPKQNMEMTIVGKETVDGQEGYWMEIGHMDEKSGQMNYGKMLVTKDDFRFHKMVIQPPGQPAMEMALNSGNPSEKAKSHMTEEMEKWHSVGNETITVPAGTFSCVHWKKDTGTGDVWFSDKISPMGMVKSVSAGQNMVLLKVITDAKDHITGPVTKFDPAAMQRQMMEKMQQQKQQKP